MRHVVPDRTDSATGVAVAGDGSVYAVGNTRTGGGSFDSDAIIVKLDAAGDEVWRETRDGLDGGFDMFHGVTLDASDRPVAVGFEMGLQSNDGNKVLMQRYTSDGIADWTHIHDGPGGTEDRAMGVASSPDDTIVMAGFVGVSLAHGERDAWLAKYAP